MIICGLILIILYLFIRKTPEQRIKEYTLTFKNYIAELQQEGVNEVGRISPYGGDQYVIAILVPTTNEVQQDDVDRLTKLINQAVEFFDVHKMLQDDGITITFQWPLYQKIIFVNRPGGFPDPLGHRTEYTLVFSYPSGTAVSVVNLAGTPKIPGPEFTSDWATVQAVCIGFTQQTRDDDPICNIISANAASAWFGIERTEAEKMINGYGFTNLAYLDQKAYKFRFIDTVYEAFVQK
jgi:type II secretory pathway pseudopilin PulG